MLSTIKLGDDALTHCLKSRKCRLFFSSDLVFGCCSRGISCIIVIKTSRWLLRWLPINQQKNPLMAELATDPAPLMADLLIVEKLPALDNFKMADWAQLRPPVPQSRADRLLKQTHRGGRNLAPATFSFCCCFWSSWRWKELTICLSWNSPMSLMRSPV